MAILNHQKLYIYQLYLSKDISMHVDLCIIKYEAMTHDNLSIPLSIPENYIGQVNYLTY